MSPRAPWALLLLALSLARAASAQPPRPLAAHGALPAPRTLLARLALADAAALVVVDAVEPGRVSVRDALALAGALDASFSIKRSPSRPPPLEPGDRALVFLRGARPPYLLVDEPRELVRLPDREAWDRWRDALRALARSAGDGEALLRLYSDWLDGPSQPLREEALRGIGDPAAPFRPLPASFVAERLRVAEDAQASPERRSASAFAAAQSPDGARLLLQSLLDPSLPLRAEVVSVALLEGARTRSPSARDAVLRALRSGDDAVRRAGLRFAGSFSADAEVGAILESIADADPDGESRSLAQRLLRRRRQR